MADRIKGITVEIGGDTTKLQSALKGLNGEIKSTQSQLKDVDKLLKMDPGNTELLAQKEKLLADAVKETKEKLETLKTAAEQANTALEKGDISQAQYDALQREIIETEQSLKGLEKQANQSATALQKIGNAGEKLKSVGDGMQEAGKKMLPVTAAVTALGTASLTTAANFESSMSQVQATMGITKDAISTLNGESVNTMDALSSLAQEMGASTAFSATECAEALNYLALAGYDTQEMADTLPTVLNLAAAGGIDLAAASDMVTDAMSALGMETSQADIMVDQMAKTASSTNTSVAQLGEGILTIGATAKSIRGGTAELNTALGILANNGIKGAEGGTHLRNVILSLQNPTDKAAEALESLGIKVYDSQGNMRSMNDILGDLNTSMNGMTSAEKDNIISKIFNKADLASVNALLANTGDTWTGLQSSIENSAGSAGQMADAQLDNLQGQLTLIKSAVEGLAISFGQLLMPTIKSVVGVVQKIVDWLNSLDEGTKKAIVTVALVVAAIGPMLIVVGNVVSAIGTIMTLVPAIVGGFTAVSTAVGAFSATLFACPLTWIIAAIVAVIAIGVLLYKNWDTIKEKAAELWANITAVFDGIRESISQAVTNIKLRVTEAFDNVKNAASEKFNAVKGAITNVMSGVSSVVQGKLANIKAAFENNGGGIKGIVAAGWTAIKEYYSTGFQALNALTGGKLGDIANAFKSKFKELASSAIGWGRDIIQGIVDGISGMIDKVKDAASKVAGAISDFLHFSEPDKGPLSNFHTFMPDMIDLMVKGINQSMEKLKTPVSNLSEALVPNTDSAIQSVSDSVNYGISALESTLGDFFAKGNESTEISVNVILEGDAAGVFKLVRQENAKLVRTAGINVLAT